MLFLGIEMAGRTKNATPKFFPQAILELPYKEIGGERSKAWRFLWKVCKTISVVQAQPQSHKLTLASHNDRDGDD